MHGRPTAQELVQAVRELLETDVLPATEGALNFRVRVARNVLAIVERELAIGPQRGLPDEPALCAAIRAGDLDERTHELVAELLPVVKARLAVAHPGYDDQP